MYCIAFQRLLEELKIDSFKGHPSQHLHLENQQLETLEKGVKYVQSEQ